MMVALVSACTTTAPVPHLNAQAKAERVRAKAEIAALIAASEARLAQIAADAAAAELAAVAWAYDQGTDPMTSAVTRLASIHSVNQINLASPYDGPQRARLVVRVRPRETAVMLSIARGQLLCPAYNGCNVEVRFDDDEATRFHARAPADYLSTMLFIERGEEFLARLRTASVVRFRATIYQGGSPVLEFRTAGLDAAKIAR